MKKKAVIWLILAFFIFNQTSGQEDKSDLFSVSDTLEDFGLFTSDNILELSLRFDMTSYQRKKPKDEYLDAILTYHISEKDSINKEIKLKSRGEFRNGYCAFPPLLLNFKRPDSIKGNSVNLNKMKLVTHCESGNESYLFREYLIYKLYNVLTDTSFRVRLVKMNYINTYKNTKPVRTYAFFIEPLDFLAARINSIPLEITTLTQRNIVPYMMDRVSIFNYMIGNTDFSVPNQHNCKVLAQPKSARPDLGIIVPYDFDYTGFVNAHYAVPPEGLGITNVRQRVYIGICRDEATFIRALKEFSDKKDQFYKVIRDFPYLDEKSKKEVTKYLDDFYKEMENKNNLARTFLSTCKKL
jgi:hypothetical protein